MKFCRKRHGYCRRMLPFLRTPTAFPMQTAKLSTFFAAETGAQISFVYEVLHNRFDAVSKNISPYIKKISAAALLTAILNATIFSGWVSGGNRVNNWNPWINSNILRTAKTVCGHDEMCRVVLKAMKSLDRYAACYPEDGACDEGPMYWFKAGVCLMECLDMFKEYSGGKNGFVRCPEGENTLNFTAKFTWAAAERSILPMRRQNPV